MNYTYEINQETARKFLLRKQGLIGEYRFIGKDGALACIKQAGSIQFDPVDVCGKNAELTLQSRVKGFQKKTLDELLYKNRLLVDYPDKELSIIPVENWPYFKDYRMRSYLHGRQFEGLEALEEQALQYIRENGPVSSSSLPIDGTIFWHSSVHWSGNWHQESGAARSVLEQMYTDGRLIIHHKEGSRKYYDLAERYIQKDLLDSENPCPDDMSHIKWRILNRIGAVGLLWNRRSDAFLGIPMNADQRNQAFLELEQSGSIIPVTVDGIKAQFFIRKEDGCLMEEAVRTPEYKPRCEFLAPLDPFLWDRKLIQTLFHFQYSWEIYTPAEKRKFGYYVLPIIYGSQFAGRIEAIRDSKESVLRVNHIWYEDSIRKTKKLENAVRKTAMRFARFNGCKEIKWLDL